MTACDDGMSRAAAFVLTLGFAAISYGAEPIVDNEHVKVWDTAVPLSPSPHDFVAVSLTRKGTADFGHEGDVRGKAGSRTIVIELKGLPVGPLANETGYPLAFPRRHAKKLLENGQVVVWDYVWHPGESTPMHFHDKDAVVVFETTGALKATTVDGTSATTEIRFGEVRFNPRGRIHTEALAKGDAHAVITELK
jgi:quercetin dioxygenase-like cupin family protein